MKFARVLLAFYSMTLAFASALAAESAVKTFNIPAQPLAEALADFSRQSDVIVLAPSGLTGGRTSNAVTGQMSPAKALDRLLDGTDLHYVMERDGSVILRGRATRAGRNAGRDSIHLAQASNQSTASVAEMQGGQSPVGRQDATTPDDDAPDESLEEIVVTAQKRQERLIDTPQSVSVLSADTLAKMGATQFRDFANTVPGLSFTTAGAGNTQVSLRGVTIGQDLGATVGIYVDETPYGSSQVFAFGPYLALDVGLFDIERIEVLRGPQGTLYGASTMGGLIKYVSKRPDTGQFSGSVRAGVSGTERGNVNYDVAAVVNIPLAADKAALRASAFESHDGGYITNVASGRDGVNRSDIYGGRLDLLLTPTDQLDVRLTGFAQNITREGEATADYTFAGTKPFGSLNQNRLINEPFDQRFRLLSGTVVYDFSETSVTSISTYQTARTALTWDLSGLFAVPLGLGAVGNPNWSKVDKFSQEVRLASSAGRTIEWAIGGFYTREKSELATEFALRDVAGAPVVNNLFVYRAPTTFEEQAVFGDLTWRLTDKLDVTGGIRYARNDQEFTQFGSGAFGFNLPTREFDEDVFTYLGNVRYHLSDRATAYVRYATGYRPGGPNIATTATAAPTFESDGLKSYEAGIKAETDNRRFAIDLSGYYIDWNNIQMSVNIGGFTSYLNAPGGASIRGGELTLSSRPVRDLTLTGAFAWQDAHLEEADPNLDGAEGERLPNVARFTGTLDADYVLSGGTLQPTLGATLRHVGDRRSSFDASTSFPQYRLPAYTTADLRAGLTFGRVDAQLYVHNLSDERGQLSLFFAQFGARVAILQPRTVGVSLTTRF
jgi:iron complex outermembrane recepter protein